MHYSGRVIASPSSPLKDTFFDARFHVQTEAGAILLRRQVNQIDVENKIQNNNNNQISLSLLLIIQSSKCIQEKFIIQVERYQRICDSKRCEVRWGTEERHNDQIWSSNEP